MFAAIRDIFLKGGNISDAIVYVFKSTGNMPTKSEGMKIIKMYQNIQKETAKIIEFPKDRITPFNKPRPTLEEMRQQLAKTIEEKKAMFPGSTDKTLFKDSPEAIAKIKAENKAAAERLKAKKKTVEDFKDEGDFDPGGMASGGIAGPLHLYDGGRARFDKGGMKRRTFLKMLGGLGALPFVGKYFKLAKTAAPAAEAAVETIKRTAGGIPEYAYDLIEVVKNKGVMDIMEGLYKRNPPQKKYTYKGIEVTEDGLGNTQVRKMHEGSGIDPYTGDTFDGISREVGFDISKGEDIVKQGGIGDDAGKLIKGDDEYFEATVRPDADGKMKDVVEEIDEADHLDLKAIADESLIKKAEGGRASLSKGGLAHVLGV